MYVGSETAVRKRLLALSSGSVFYGSTSLLLVCVESNHAYGRNCCESVRKLLLTPSSGCRYYDTVVGLPKSRAEVKSGFKRLLAPSNGWGYHDSHSLLCACTCVNDWVVRMRLGSKKSGFKRLLALPSGCR